MAANDGYRRYVEAAAVLGQITRARAEEIMREVMSGGDVPRAQAQEWVDEMVERSRKATESIVDMIRNEVANQMAALGIDPEDLARQAADIIRRSADAGRRVMQDVAQSRGVQRRPRPGDTAPAGRTSAPAAKTAPAPAKQSAPRKAAPKKASTKAAAPKKAAPKKAAPKKASAARPAKKKGSGTTP